MWTRPFPSGTASSTSLADGALLVGFLGGLEDACQELVCWLELSFIRFILLLARLHHGWVNGVFLDVTGCVGRISGCDEMCRPNFWDEEKVMNEQNEMSHGSVMFGLSCGRNMVEKFSKTMDLAWWATCQNRHAAFDKPVCRNGIVRRDKRQKFCWVILILQNHDCHATTCNNACLILAIPDARPRGLRYYHWLVYLS